jgi:subtilisin family serine protease
MRCGLTASLAAAAVLSTSLVATAGASAASATGEAAVSAAHFGAPATPPRPVRLPADRLPRSAGGAAVFGPRVAHLDPALVRPGRRAAERVHVQISGSAGPAAAAVRRAGGRVLARAPGEISATVPRSALASLAGAAGVADVAPAVQAVPDAVTSQGVQASGASTWQAAGTTGAGVTIAIVDVGFKNLGQEINVGNLANVDYQSDNCTDINATEHGTAVAEIVHQMAPSARLRLYCISDTVGFQAAATDILNQPAATRPSIVTSSLSFPGDSRGDGTGDASAASTTVQKVRRAGILWIVSAGNTAENHWSGALTDSDRDGLTDLDGTGLSAEYDAVLVNPGENASVYLSWDQWPASSLGVSLVVTGYTCTSSMDCSTRIPGATGQFSKTQVAGQTPVLSIDVPTNTTSSDQEWAVQVRQPTGNLGVRYELSYYGNSNLSYLSGVSASRAASGSIDEPASSPYALAVGAAEVSNGALEPYSSRGPTIDGRVKPDLTGYDDVSSNLDEFSAGFAGTSAAAPHVAGAAALIKSANSSLDAAQLQALLETRASGGANAAAAPTNDVGHGLLDLGGPPPVTAPSGSVYSALATPLRVLDTRPGQPPVSGPKGKLGPGEVVTVNLSNAPAGATAVAVNLGGTLAEGNTYLTAYPTNDPGTSTLNLNQTDSTAAVFTVVPIGANNTVRVRNAGARTYAFIDVLGYFVPTGGLRYTAVAPTRIKDTRVSPPYPTRVASQSTTAVGTSGTIPANATSVVVNVTAANATGTGYLSLSPDGARDTSTLNYSRYTRANTTIVKLDSNQRFQVFNGGPPTDFVIDIVGYFSTASTGSTFVPLTPVRVMDTRTGNGGGHKPLGPGGTLTVTGSGIFDVPYTANALVAGVVPVPSPTSPESFLTIYPSAPRPTTSSVNFTSGRLVPNGVIMKLAPSTAPNDLTRTSQIFNSLGQVDVVLDVFGYFIS